MTKSVSFTPGPWKQGRKDYSYFEHGGMTLKCSTVGIDGSNGDVDICRIVIGDPLGEGAANSRLIAAAPELLEALEAAVAIIQGWEQAAPIDIAFVADRARAAITKATGRQP